MSDILEEAEVIIKQAINPDAEIADTPVADDMVSSFFRVNENEINNRDRDRINDIASYLDSQTKDIDPLDKEMEKINILRSIKNNLGIPQMGISQLEQIHNYIKIKMSITFSEAKLRAMEG
jgi:hypothetical protein